MATVDEILTARAYAVDDEIWTADNSYPSNRLYVEPEYVPVTNKRIVDFNDQISVYGEQNVQFVGFQLPRYDDGIDLTVQNLYIHYQTAHGGSDSVPCNVSWSDNYVRLLWEIPGQATQEPGTIQVMIYATSTSSTGVRTVWKTLPATYTIHDGLEIGGGILEPDHSWYEQFMQQMESRVSTALGYANDAQASKTAAADSATESAKSATASARALEENKAYVESQKEAFAGYNRRETDLKYANALIDSASGTTQVTVSDAWEAPIPGLEIAGKSEQGADPSPDNPQEIVSTDVTAVTVTGAQLLDIPSLSTKNYLGVTYSPQPDGTVIATGTSTGTSYIDLRIQEPLPLGDYYISGCPNGGGGDGYQLMAYAVNNGSYKVIGSDIGNGSRFTVTDDNPIAIRIVMRLSISGPLTFKPMLNAGDTALPWEPYQSKTAAITLTEPLRGIGDVRDRIMCRDGVWGIERKIVPLILNGSEAWHQFNTSGSKSFGAADFDSRIKIDSALLCDRLSEDVTNNVWIGKRDNTIATSGSSTRYIRIFLNSTATLDTLKALLSAEPMHVIAERKSPAWEPLPADTQSALNALTTYTGTTHVTVTAGGPEPDVGLEYFGQPGDKVTVQDMCDSFAAPGFDDSGVVEEITSFQSFYDKFVSGMKIRDFFRNLKAGLKFVLHTGQLVNNGLCNEPGKYPLDAAYGRTLLEMIGNTANLPGGAADIVSAIVTQNSNLSQKANSSDLTNVSNVAAAANGKVELSGGPIKIIAYAGDGNWSFQQQYGDGVILSLGMNDTQIFYDYYDGKTWTRKWTK